MHINFSKKFHKKYHKSGEKIKSAFDHRLKLFAQNQNNSILNNHSLTGVYRGYRSINVTGDWRAIYREYIDNKHHQVFIFELIGTHSQLYG